MFNMRTMLCVILLYTMFQNAAFSEKVLLPHDLSALDKFGSDIAVDGDVVLVGALGDNNTYQGAAYIFERHARGTNTWDEVVKLTASPAYPYDYYGWAVAVAGDVAVVGAPYAYKDGTTNYTGRAYIYERDAGEINTWLEVAMLWRLTETSLLSVPKRMRPPRVTGQVLFLCLNAMPAGQMPGGWWRALLQVTVWQMIILATKLR